MTANDGVEIARRFVEDAWDKGNMSALRSLLADTFVDHGPSPGEALGVDGYLGATEVVFRSFPDLRMVSEDVLASGDKVVLRWTAYATHTGEFLGVLPTNREVTFEGVEIMRVVGNKIVERWGGFDRLSLIRQLGVRLPLS